MLQLSAWGGGGGGGAGCFTLAVGTCGSWRCRCATQAWATTRRSAADEDSHRLPCTQAAASRRGKGRGGGGGAPELLLADVGEADVRLGAAAGDSDPAVGILRRVGHGEYNGEAARRAAVP